MTFKEVAERHRISVTQAVSIFDKAYPEVKGRKLPKILLIDEFKFNSNTGKYACHLVDFETSETVDLIGSRRKEYLDEFFSQKPLGERSSVKLLVTDMHDEYAATAKKWLPNAKIVVDRFHIVVQMTRAVNTLRIKAMSFCEKGSVLYAFMKKHWKVFLKRTRDIPDRQYTKKSTGEIWHFDELVRASLGLSWDFSTAYFLLQEILKTMRTTNTHHDALERIRYISNQLISTKVDILQRVGQTYLKWENAIAMGLAKCEFGFIVSNGKIEAGNDVAQTMIDDAYGYRNFKRFRKRFLLLRWM